MHYEPKIFSGGNCPSARCGEDFRAPERGETLVESVADGSSKAAQACYTESIRNLYFVC
jgi:hypothetical protein